jgi:hypothetical protein
MKIYLVVDNLTIFTIFLVYLSVCAHVKKKIFFIIFCRAHVYLKAIIGLEDFFFYELKLFGDDFKFNGFIELTELSLS